MSKVYLQKPDIVKLKEDGYTLVDMHIHSEYSCDASIKIKDIVKRAKKLGMGIAITDHNKIEGSIEAKKHGKGILVIPAIEARSREGIDILLYFYKTKDLISFYDGCIKPNKKKNFQGSSKLSVIEIMELSKKYKCLVCIAHPYRFSPKKIYNILLRKRRNKQLFKLFKIIEVINGKNLKIKNKKAIKKAEQLEKYFIAGSDAHRLKEIGTTITCSKNVSSVQKFLDNIIYSKDVIVVGKETRFSYRLVRPLVSIKNAVSHGIKKL